jgi:hypothetical protein
MSRIFTSTRRPTFGPDARLAQVELLRSDDLDGFIRAAAHARPSRHLVVHEFFRAAEGEDLRAIICDTGGFSP